MPTVVVIGHGMVGQRFCEELARRDPAGEWEVDVVGAEPVPAYDRVALSRCFEGADPADLSLVPDGFFDGGRRRLHLGDAATDVDLRGRLVRTASGRRLRYDGAGMRFPNAPEADRFLTRQYRPGWEVA